MSKPTWFKPAFERPDNREFKLGEMVKVHKDFRPKNDTYMDLNYHYYIVFDDGRNKKHRTYTYGLDRCYPPIEYDEEGSKRVYGYYPKDIEPCTEAEKVLYYKESSIYNAIYTTIEHIDITVSIDGNNDGKSKT